MQHLYPTGGHLLHEQGCPTNKKNSHLRLFTVLLAFLSLCLPQVSKAGDIYMTKGSVITTCSDNFYDSGGPGGYYNDMENKTITIYPSTPGAKVTVDFTYFDLEDSYDFLNIYDGSSTSAPHLGEYTGTKGPGTVTSTADDGSLTFHFESDAYVTNPGWEATVSCSSLPACSGVIDAGTAVSSSTSTICPGESLSLSLTGFTAASDITYQWEESSTGTGGWTAISGATTSPYIFTPAPGTTYYRCVTECATSGSTSTSTVVSVAVGGSPLPYIEDFETTSYGTIPSCTYTTFPSPWGDGVTVYDYPSYPYSLDNHTPGGTNYLYAGYCTGYCYGYPDYFFTPGFNLEAGKTYQFSYWYNTDGYGTFTTGAYIGPDQDPGSLTAALGPDVSTNTTTYEQYIANFTVAADASYFIGIKIQATGYYGMVIDDIGLMELPACTGTPAYAGKATASPGLICSTPGSTTLSVSGAPAVSGLTFQWYEAAALAGPYSPISGATTNPYSPSGISSAKFYYCEVGCSAGGSTQNTDTVSVKVAPLNPPYVEDFETGKSGINMPCASYSGSWDMYSYWYLYTSPHPWGSGLDNHTPGGSKWLFAGAGLGPGTGGSPTYWFSPAINFTAGKAYNVSYWYRTDGYGASYNFGARIGSSQSDAAMTTMVGTDITSSTSTYTKFSGDFVAGSTGPQYLGIRYQATDWYDGSAIDDIGLTQLPPCSAKPTAGAAVASPSLICSPGASGTTLSLKGLSAASDLSYQWQSSPSGLAGTFTNITGATSPAYSTPALSSPVCYRCVVTCGLISAPNTDTSSVTCVSIGPLVPPYLETFESATAGTNQPCASNTYSWDAGSDVRYFYYWGIKDKPGTYYPTMDNHTAGGSKYLSSGYYVGSYGLGTPTGDQQYWFTPGLQLTGGIAYKCNYWYVAGSSSVSVNYGLYYGTAQSASSMMPMRSDISGENSTTYKEMVGAFTAPTTGVYYVGVKVNHTKYGVYGAAIDDIGVEQLPDCTAKPVAGTISSIPSMICTSGTATFTLSGTSMASKLSFQWQDSTAAGWADVTTGTGGTTAVYRSGTLSTSRKYRCIVTCPLIGAPNKDTTAVYLMNVGSLTPPYVETFESGTEGVNMPCASYTTGWSAGYLWYLYSSPFSSSYPAIINHTPGGNKYLYAGYGLYYYYSPQYWFSPAIKFTSGETYEFSYWYNGSGASGGSTSLGMAYGTSQSAGAMVPIRTDLTGVNTSTYKQLIGRFVAPSSGDYYLGIKVYQTSYGYPGIVIDDIGLNQLPPCSGKPTVGAISAAPSMLCSAGGTVVLDMDLSTVSKASGLSYRWEYTTIDPVSAFIPTGTSAALSSPMYTSTSLPSTTWFRCIIKCTLTGDSTISSVMKVDVGVIIPPYIETFETGTPGVNMPCASYTHAFGAYYYWNVMGSPMTYSTSPLYNHTTGGSKYLIAGNEIGYYSGSPEMWFTPAIKFTSGKLYQLSYWYLTDGYAGAGYGLAAFMGNAQTKAAMTTPIGTAFSPSNTSYKMFKTQFTPTASGDFYIGIRKSQTNWAYGLAIDDIGLQEVPPCSAPVAAGTIFADPLYVCASGGTTTLDISGGTLATGLKYEWFSAPSATGPFVSTTSASMPYTTDPLASTTWFKVVVTCVASGATDTSAAYKVNVGGRDLPYVEDFETTSAGSTPLCSDATKWSTDPYNGWMVYGGTVNEYVNHTPGGRNFLIGGYILGSPSSTGTDNYWFTPGLNMRSGYKYQLSFYYLARTSWSTGSNMGVYYGRSQTSGGMTTNLIPWRQFSNNSYSLYDTTFTMPTGGVIYFGFRKSGYNPTAEYSYYGVGFDDININYAPCDGTPFAGVISSSKPSGTAYCFGTPLTLTDIGATISLVPGIKYQWQRKSLSTATPWTNVVGATDTVLKSDTLVGYEYRMAVICTNSNDTALSPSFIVAALPPHPNVSIAPSTTPTTYCLGDTVKFNATSYTGALYDWMLDSVVVPGWKFSDMGATEPGTYMVRVTSGLSPCPAYSNQVKLVINDPGYKVDITTPADSIICAGSSVMLNGTSTKSGVTYQWRKDNVIIPGAVSASLLVTSTGYYRLTASDGISSCAAVSRNVLITVKPNPPALITVPGGSTTACAEVGVRLNANVGGFSYEWMRGGSTIYGWDDSSQLIKNSGTYAVKVRTADGCVGISAPITVNILPSPIPVISKTGLVLSVTPATFVTYQWVRDGKDIPGANSNSFTLKVKGLYKVRVTDVNGCSGESAPFDAQDGSLLAIDESNIKVDEIKLYPNPTTSKVFVESPIDLDIEVKDVAGKSILKVKDAKEIDLGKYADGVYLFIISNKDDILKQQRVTKTSK